MKWLGGFLPTIRTLWLRSTVNEPAGPDLFAQEAVSPRVRVRTSTASRTGSVFASLSLGGIPADSEAGDRLLAAELGITSAIPMVLRQLFLIDPVDLWLPMSADGDTSFPLLDPDAEEAQSVLGLLLRNSALRVAADATDEFSGIHAGLSAERVGRTAYIPTPVNPAISVTSSIAAMTAGPGKDASGQTFVIKDRLQQIVEARWRRTCRDISPVTPWRR